MANLKAKPKPPPPNQYDEEQRASIIEHVIGELASGRSVASILSEDEDMPAPRTFWRWHMEDEGLQQQVVRARDNGIEALMEKARHIAETPMMGVTETEKMVSDGEGGSMPFTEVKREDMLGHRKLQIETIFKSAQMLKPKTYGPKLDLTSQGEKIGLTQAILAAKERQRKREENGE